MGYSYLVTHPDAEHAEQGLTLLSGRDVVLSLWYSDCQLGKWIIQTERAGEIELINNDNFDATDLRF